MKLVDLGQLMHTGSVKTVHRHGEGLLAFRFSSDFSAFDVGRHPQAILGKAEAVCACAVRSFEIAGKVGVPTHFVEQLDPVTILIKEAQIITGRSLTLQDADFVVPVEWISRFRVAGGIHRDFTAGSKKPTAYGFSTDDVPEVGTPFPYPVHQFTTKFEAVDRELSWEEACAMAGLSTQDAEEYWAMIDRLNGAIGLALTDAGYVHLDGKIECLMGPEREKMIADVFGTPDEDRFCPATELAEGIVVHYSKEHLREVLMAKGYYAEVIEARAREQPVPPYPRLTDEEIAEASRRYCAVSEAYAGVRIAV